LWRVLPASISDFGPQAFDRVATAYKIVLRKPICRDLILVRGPWRDT
jgi:hypothetical protein